MCSNLVHVIKVAQLYIPRVITVLFGVVFQITHLLYSYALPPKQLLSLLLSPFSFQFFLPLFCLLHFHLIIIKRYISEKALQNRETRTDHGLTFSQVTQDVRKKVQYVNVHSDEPKPTQVERGHPIWSLTYIYCTNHALHIITKS